MPRHATRTSFKAGKANRHWKGGTHDYWHRKAREIVRCPKGLIVHHIDGNYKNNSLDNLQIMSQSKHVSLHNKLRTVIRKKNTLRLKFKDVVNNLNILGYSSRKLAKLINVSKNTVLRLCNEVKMEREYKRDGTGPRARSPRKSVKKGGRRLGNC